MSAYYVEVLGRTLRVVDADGNDVELMGEVNIANRRKAEKLAARLNRREERPEEREPDRDAIVAKEVVSP